MKQLFYYLTKNGLFLAVFLTQISLTVPLKAMETTEEEPRISEETTQLEHLPDELLIEVALNLFPETITDSSQNPIVGGFIKLSKLMLTNKRFYTIVHDPYFLGLLEKRLISSIEDPSLISAALSSLNALGVKDQKLLYVLNKANEQIILMRDASDSMLNKDIEKFKKIIAKIDDPNFSVFQGYSIIDEADNVVKKYSKIPALDVAISSGRKNFVESLLEHGADPNIYLPSGLTLLTAAATFPKSKGTELVELLLSKGVEINTKDRFGSTALNIAAHYGNNELVSLLIKRGASIESRASQSLTPFLNNAANRIENLRNQLETALVLIKNGADINAQADNGKTALMFAVKHDNPQLVGMLLKYGANTELPDITGQTALSIAKKKNNPQILKLFAPYKKRE